MGSSSENYISTASLSPFKRQGGILRFTLLFLLAFNCLSLVAAAPTDPTAVGLPDDQKRDLDARSAGLAWGPVTIGNLKLYLTNPHDGYAGPKFPNANHVNFHVDKQGPRNSYVPVVNLHIVKYSSGGKSCLYAWDSVTSTTVFDSCFDDFGTAVREAVGAIKNFVDTLLQNADFIAAIAIIAALVAALLAALSTLPVVALA